MPNEKIGILIHGGVTRRMLTIEVGRYSKRDVKFNDAAKALEYVRTWLGVPATPAEPSPAVPTDDGTLMEWGKDADGYPIPVPAPTGSTRNDTSLTDYQRGFNDGRVSSLNELATRIQNMIFYPKP